MNDNSFDCATHTQCYILDFYFIELHIFSVHKDVDRLNLCEQDKRGCSIKLPQLGPV